MVSHKFAGKWKTAVMLMVMCIVALSPLTGTAAEDKEKPPPKPITTGNPDIAIEELKHRLNPLTKDDLAVEADGWLQVIKKHSQELSDAQIAILKAKDDEKTTLLESVSKLQEQQTRLIDRLSAVIEEFRSKGGKVDDYEAYIATISGIDLKLGALSANWALVTGWLTSAEGGLRWLKNIILFFVVVLASWILAVLIGKAVKKAVVRIDGASELLKDFIVNITRKLIFIVGFVVALSMLEINIGPLLAAIGAAGFIVGFALQGTLSNFAAGIMILIYRPFDVGDLVDIADTSGTVDAMTIVSTTLKTIDNQIVVLPNNMIWGDKIINITGSDIRRVDMVFGIGYSDDIAKAQKILEEILLNHEATLKDPEPMVKVHELGDSSVNFVVRPWVKTEDYWDVYWDVTRTVKERFDAEGVSIPFPQRDVHMHQVATT
ncbi:MAG: mechanosensitive ion channel [Desulfobacterales bacterium]|jgi:small conductance mechanosensitive channel